jgi:hypothetical protein
MAAQGNIYCPLYSGSKAGRIVSAQKFYVVKNRGAGT